jgi:hypothetical protein
MQNLPVKSFQCPKCSSENTSSLEIAHKNGLKHTAPPTVDSLGIKDYLLAGLIAFGMWYIGSFLIGFLGQMIFGGLGVLGVILFWLLTIILPIYYLLKRKNSINKNNAFFRGDMQTWQNTWLCQRCGKTWLIKSQ